MCIHRRLNISMMPAHRYVCLYTHTHMRDTEKHRKHSHIQIQVCKPGQLLPCATYVVTQGITVRGAPLGLMIYCHAFEMFNTFEQMHTHVLSISFCLILSSHLVFTLEVPTKLRCQPVRMKTAYCRRRGRLYLLYLESCLMMTSRWQHQAESSLISGWKGKKGRAGRGGRCIHPFPESLAISQSNRFSRFTHFILLRLYFYPIHFFSFTFNIFLFFCFLQSSDYKCNTFCPNHTG